MTQANTDFGRVADDLRRAAGSFALLASAATAFGTALGAFRDFERQLTLTNAIAGGTVEQFNRMKDAARSFALVTTVSAVDAGVALQQLAQAGFTAEESLSAMNGVLLLSQATLTDVAVTSDVLSSNIRAFGLEAQDTTRVANVFTATITGSLATMEKLAFAFRQVAPVAELAGLSIEETSAALGVLFNVGLRGEQAGTALRNIIIRLIRPLGEANDLLQNAGIATRNATGGLRNLADILRQIAASDLTNADLARIFETEALAGVKAFIKALEDIDSTGDDAYNRLLKNVTGTDRALEIAAKNLNTFDGSMKLLRNSVNDVAISIGEQLAPFLRQAADGTRRVLAAFRELTPELQAQITFYAGLAAGIVLLLGVLNAFSLLLNGPLIRGLLVVAKVGLTPLIALFAVATKAIATFVAGLATISVATGGVTVAAGASSLAVRGLVSAFAAFLATPVGAGLALITAGVVALGAAYRLATKDAREAAAELERINTIELNIARQDAQAIADAILPEGVLGEIKGRVDDLNGQLGLINTVGGPSDIVGTSNRKLNEVSREQSFLDTYRKEIEAEFANVAEVEQQLSRLTARREEALANLDVRGNSQTAKAITIAIEQILEGLNPDEIAGIEELRDARATYEDNLGEFADIASGFIDARDRNVSKLIQQLGTGDAVVPERLQAAAELLAGQLDTSPKMALALREEIQARANADGSNLVAIAIEEGFRQLGVSSAKIAEIMGSIQEEQNNEFLTAIGTLTGANAEIADEAYRAILDNTLATTNDIVEATRAATELANIELEDGLFDVADELRGNYDEILGGFADAQTEAILGAFNDTKSAADEIAGDPSFAEVVSGQAVLNAINDQIRADSTPEQIAAIIDEQFAIYAALMDDFVIAMIEAGTITQEQADAISAAFKSSADAAKAAALAGLEGATTAVDNTVKAATSRIKRASGGGGGGRKKRGGGGGGGGGGGKDPAKEALQDARKLEDAFRDAERQSLKAREAFIENVAGLDVNTRIGVTLDLELEKINQDADRQITQLRRKLEDLKLDGKATAQLEAQYNKVISEIERARDAEIQAANSFDAQMKRRSEALDLFIRDLKTAANEATDTFSKVAAGIGVAFAEYNKDLVTLVDITSNAVTGFLDAVTTGVADFIFDNENAFENFKKTMLNLSRQVFEGFTKALLQQAISSLTDGGGSIFGNLLQPSRAKAGTPENSQAPGVGSGGLLGGLFGGNKANEAGGAQSIQQGTAAIAQSLQQGAVQINQALSQVGLQTRAGGQQVSGGLRNAGQQAQQGGQQVGQSLRQAGQQIGQAGGQAANSIRTQSAGGIGGGGGGFLGSIFGGITSLFGFAHGGMVSQVHKSALQSIAAFAEGGSVKGMGTGTSDDILAFLSDGEFVVNAKMTKEFLPLLEAINNGAVKGDTAGAILAAMGGKKFGGGFSEGGLVGVDSFNGSPSINITAPRPLVVERGMGSTSNTTFDQRRGGDTVINVSYTANNSGSSDERTQRRSADQLAARIGRQIDRAKKNA